jgi:hypothetical protein
MVRELSTAALAPALAARMEPGQPSADRPPVLDTRGAVGPTVGRPAEPIRPVEQAVQLAASALFRDRQVEVEGFRDEASGRFVYRIADRRSGEVLMQAPPEALLRFFASAREALGPLVEFEA